MSSLEEAVLGRRSSRAFDRDRPVPMAVLREVFELARHAPSNCNAQPWRVYVVTGEAREALQLRLLEAERSGAAPDEDPTPAFRGVYRELQVACAVNYFARLGIERHDHAARAEVNLRNFEFFDAPHVAILCMDASFGVGVALDLGAYLQTLLLGLTSRGIGSCAQASLRRHATLIKHELNIPEELRVLCGVSFGYELPDAPANRVRQTRASIDEHVAFVGF